MSTKLLDNVRKAIRSKGALWTAGETSISRLSAKVRASMLSQTPFSPILPPRSFPSPLPPLPESFDWTNVEGSNYVTPAKQQDGGTCAAYASTAALESCVLRMGLSHNTNLDLAEHAIIGTIGGGGNLHGIAAFMQTNGLPPESLYPADPATAASDWQAHAYRLASWDCLYPSVVEEVKAFLVQNGPVVTTMNCPPDFFYYTNGVYSNVYGQPGGFHAILVVGYNDEEHCFKVKNSWGKAWGQEGFGYIDYSEFRSTLVNFGWDIHTYPKALGPYVVPVLDVAGFIAVDPLSLLLREDIYIKLRLPDPAPDEVIHEYIQKTVSRMTPEQKIFARARVNSLKTYVTAMEKALRKKD